MNKTRDQSDRLSYFKWKFTVASTRKKMPTFGRVFTSIFLVNVQIRLKFDNNKQGPFPILEWYCHTPLIRDIEGAQKTSYQRGVRMRRIELGR